MSFHPAIGRWVQTDPEPYVDGLNLYEPVRSNPLRYTDAFGRAAATTQPTPAPARPNTWVIPGGFDLVLIGDPGIYEGYNEGFWKRYAGANPDSKVLLVHSGAQVADTIVARSVELRKQKNAKPEVKVPITVLIITHGTYEGGEVYIGRPGNHEALLPEPPDKGIIGRDADDVRDDLSKMPLARTEGYILSMTFAACNVAGTEAGESLLKLVRDYLGAQWIRAPKRLGHVYPFGNAVGVDLVGRAGEKITQQNLGNFIYTTPQRDARKAE